MDATTVYSIIQWVGISVMVVIIAYALTRKPSSLQTHLLFLAITTFVASVIYLFEIKATALDEIFIYAKLEYLGKSYMMVAAMLFVTDICKIKLPEWLKYLIMGLAFVVSTVAITSSDTQQLFYTTKELVVESNGFIHAKFGHGPFYYVNIALIGICSMVSVFATIKTWFKVKTKKEKGEVYTLFVIILLGVIGYVIYMFAPTNGYDTTMPFCIISAFLFLAMFFRYRIFDALTMAKEKAIDDFTSGVIIIDQNENPIYLNRIGNSVVEHSKNMKESIFKGLEKLYEDKTYLFCDNKVYSVNVTEIYHKAHNYGKLIELTDVTESYNYQATLEREVRIRTKSIKKIQRGVVSSLANIVEARDESTGTHIKNTSDYVRLICENLKELGYYTDILTDDYIDILTAVAPLHDIGKITVPDNILKKPGKLTDEEFEVIKSHSKVGADLIEENLRGVESDEYVDVAKEVALYHHEKFNGKGYPRGLVGQAIPLSGRIMALADVYDALTSPRCYKPAFTQEKSLEIITLDAGSHFDPKIVEAFKHGLGVL